MSKGRYSCGLGLLRQSTWPFERLRRRQRGRRPFGSIGPFVGRVTGEGKISRSQLSLCMLQHEGAGNEFWIISCFLLSYLQSFPYLSFPKRFIVKKSSILKRRFHCRFPTCDGNCAHKRIMGLMPLPASA